MERKTKRRDTKRYGQTFTREDAEWLGALMDMLARGGDTSVMRESDVFRKLYAQIVRLRMRVRADLAEEKANEVSQL